MSNVKSFEGVLRAPKEIRDMIERRDYAGILEVIESGVPFHQVYSDGHSNFTFFVDDVLSSGISPNKRESEVFERMLSKLDNGSQYKVSVVSKFTSLMIEEKNYHWFKKFSEKVRFFEDETGRFDPVKQVVLNRLRNSPKTPFGDTVWNRSDEIDDVKFLNILKVNNFDFISMGGTHYFALSVLYSHSDFFDFFLKNGIIDSDFMERKNKSGESPLCYLMAHKKFSHVESYLRYIGLNNIENENSTGYSGWYLASSFDVSNVKKLLKDAGAGNNSQEVKSVAAGAISLGRVEVLEMLMKEFRWDCSELISINGARGGELEHPVFILIEDKELSFNGEIFRLIAMDSGIELNSTLSRRGMTFWEEMALMKGGQEFLNKIVKEFDKVGYDASDIKKSIIDDSKENVINFSKRRFGKN